MFKLADFEAVRFQAPVSVTLTGADGKAQAFTCTAVWRLLPQDRIDEIRASEPANFDRAVQEEALVCLDGVLDDDGSPATWSPDLKARVLRWQPLRAALSITYFTAQTEAARKN